MPTSDTKFDEVAYMKTYRVSRRKAGYRRVGITLDPAEYERVAASAKRHGEPVTTHLKKLAIAQLDTRYIVPPDIESRLDNVISIMRGIGNNLNQLARHSNEMKAFLDTDSVRLQIKHLERSVAEFVGKPERSERSERSKA